ncbi:MAG: Cys-tRNA(Pro) deacylase [Oscillospiraceae bacterium]|jgi:Cys-tRNA(Pro)/Cys-tRNA(Cys) deacylase|nr:Cys-tRNA(Pro) deacylase [Oscillospiraceae bacterium]
MAAKTNAMRILEREKVAYRAHEYPHEEGVAVEGTKVAALLGQDPAMVFKTLVAAGGGGHYVFVIPVGKELDLKRAAKAAGAKSVALLPVKELLPVTGYVRGGCSPVGMKKAFPTFFDESILGLGAVMVSGGKIGCQVELGPADLLRVTRGKAAPLAME